MAATATYPPPPPYYKLYKDYIQNPNSAPEQLPPIESTYVLFGANYTERFYPFSRLRQVVTHHGVPQVQLGCWWAPTFDQKICLYFGCRRMMCFQAWKNKESASCILRDLILVCFHFNFM
ncbi:hypothetical protein RHSIM_Rhsim04G0093100 [Rhododendron simsii]|uniref:Uncharacterized protein n=1 Tax=Rhododendron simsii TaxID=118357 RepID=A0A834LMP3_RHOSS|nr:hypothetical protein RHSIM_Rhsim04G0093100 [Rhododendron simsii]